MTPITLVVSSCQCLTSFLIHTNAYLLAAAFLLQDAYYRATPVPHAVRICFTINHTTKKVDLPFLFPSVPLPTSERRSWERLTTTCFVPDCQHVLLKVLLVLSTVFRHECIVVPHAAGNYAGGKHINQGYVVDLILAYLQHVCNVYVTSGELLVAIYLAMFSIWTRNISETLCWCCPTIELTYHKNVNALT